MLHMRTINDKQYSHVYLSSAADENNEQITKLQHEKNEQIAKLQREVRHMFIL